MSAEDFRIKIGIIKKRKKKNEYWKARKTSKSDEQEREAYKNLFEMVEAKKKND